MKDQDEGIKILHTSPVGFGQAQAAVIDNKIRNAEAIEKHPEFFNDPEHLARIKKARKILDDFFEVKTIYQDSRANRGKPFTVLKVTNHTFPRVSLAEKKRRYRDPLAELDVEIKLAAGTNSYLYYIR